MSVFPCSTDLFPSPLYTPPLLCTSKEKGGRRRYLLAPFSLFRLCSLSFPYCQQLEPCTRVQHREPMPCCFNEKVSFVFYFLCFSRSTTTRTLHHTPRHHFGESGSGPRSVSSPHRCCSASPLLPSMALFSLQLIRRHCCISLCSPHTRTHTMRVSTASCSPFSSHSMTTCYLHAPVFRRLPSDMLSPSTPTGSQLLHPHAGMGGGARGALER